MSPPASIVARVRGLEIARTMSGGKAGRGCNVTASFRVTGWIEGVPVCRYFRFRVEEHAAANRAFNAALTWARESTRPPRAPRASGPWIRSGGSHGGCGATWRHTSGAVVRDCGHPTALRPYQAWNAAGLELRRESGQAFTWLREAQAAALGLEWDGQKRGRP